MKSSLFKKLLSLVMITLLVLPTLAFASSGLDVSIKSIYFRDEDGNMVYLDYEEAINQSIEGDSTFYDAVVEYVGVAEEKGRELYLETSTGKILDYKAAMINNLFRLQDILDEEEYEVDGEIEYTHELRIVNGEAKIVEVVPPVDIVVVMPVDGITVDVGTSEDEVIDLLPSTTTITDSDAEEHIVNLSWIIEDYNNDVEGEYIAIGRFSLPEGIENNRDLNLEVKTTVKVIDMSIGFPEAVEEVVVGKSIITENTYANINIKGEYVNDVEVVYVDNQSANRIEDNHLQWRIKVEDGTTVDDLRGRITVDGVEEPVPDPEEDAEIIAIYRPSFIPTFGYVSVEVANVEGAAKFDVVYHLSDSDDGTVNVTETDIVSIGEETGMVFYDTNQYDTVIIRIYDASEELIHTFTDVRLIQQ